LNAGQNESALAAIEQSLRCDPAFWHANYNFGIALKISGGSRSPPPPIGDTWIESERSLWPQQSR